jgi:hypothetical protein
MYIPTSFFSSQGSCIQASGTSISGSGNIVTGSFTSGSDIWNYIQFTSNLSPGETGSFTASFNVLSGSTSQAKLLIVAGGGGGGSTDCFNYGDCGQFAGGGGGGGGIVYYDNFTISSGSYEIAIGTGGHSSDNQGGYAISISSSLQVSASAGQDSYFKNKDYPYTPFSTQYIIAKGGGAGGQYWRESPSLQSEVSGDVGGNGGGPVRGWAEISNRYAIQSNGDGLGGLNGANQGNSSGGCLNDGVYPWTNSGGAGGGGAASVGGDALSGGPYAGAGGNGVQYNLTGTAEYCGAGGGGCGSTGVSVITAANGLGYGEYGSGGRGGAVGWFGGGQQSESGTNGLVIIAWKTCAAQLPTCNLKGYYAGYTGQVNLTLSASYATYTNCASTASATVTIRKNDGIVVCATSGASYSFIDGNGITSSCEDCSSYGNLGTTLLPYTSGTLGTCYLFDFYNNTTSSQTASYYACGDNVTTSIIIPPNKIFTISAHENSQSISAGTITNANILSWPSSYCPNPLIPSNNNLPSYPNVAYMIVAGGGGGGNGGNRALIGKCSGGGGGAGGFLMGTTALTAVTTYPITIGLGGKGSTGSGTGSAAAANGTNSTAFSLTAIGGGAGGWSDTAGSSGGSGGGAGAINTSTDILGGAGTSGQGFAGGTSNFSGGKGAGGGGAYTTGGGKYTGTQGYGAAGKYWYDGLPYAGGGGGGRCDAPFNATGLPGGPDTGGDGNCLSPLTQATNGKANTGSGGGGSGVFGYIGTLAAGSGSAGVVKIRYSGTTAYATGGTITSGSNYIEHTFTSSGDFITN